MAFISMLFAYIVIILIIIGCSTVTAIVLFIVAAVMKKRQLKAKESAELYGNYNYKIKKIYLVPKVFGFVCMIPLTLSIILIVYSIISFNIYKNTSLSYNVLVSNIEQVETLLDKGASPDCTKDSNNPAENGEKTLLYLLADGMLYSYNVKSEETHDDTLKIMSLLIEYGADVNHAAYKHEKDYENHKYSDEYSIYDATDRCGWTPLMVATYYHDFDMIKLLVDNGADINAVDFCGYNVIDIIADNLDDEEGYEILNYYLEKGADPNNVTNYNQDALWLANRHFGNSTPLENDKIRETLGKLSVIPSVSTE